MEPYEQQASFSSSVYVLRKKSRDERSPTTIIKVKYDPRKEAAPRKHQIEHQFHQEHSEQTQESINQFNQVLSQVDVNKTTKQLLVQLKEKAGVPFKSVQNTTNISSDEKLFFENMMDPSYMTRAKVFLSKLGLNEIRPELFVKGMTHISFIPPSIDYDSNTYNPSVLSQCNDEFQPLGGQLFTTLCNKFMYGFLRYREQKNNTSEKNLRWFLEDALNIERRGSEFEIQFNYFNMLRNDVLHHIAKELGLSEFVLYDATRLKSEAPQTFEDTNNVEDTNPPSQETLEIQLETIAHASAMRSLLYLIETHYDFNKACQIFEEFMIPKLAEYIQKETTVLTEDQHYPQMLFDFLNKQPELKDKFYVEYRFVNQFIDEDGKRKVHVALIINDKQWEKELSPNFTEGKFLLAKHFYQNVTQNPVLLRKLIEHMANFRYIYSLEKLTGVRDQQKRK